MNNREKNVNELHDSEVETTEAEKINEHYFSNPDPYFKMQGRGPSQISSLLTEENVLNPTAYHRREGRNPPSRDTGTPYRWNSSPL